MKIETPTVGTAPASGNSPPVSAVYVGGSADLKGCTALLRDSVDPGYVVAQFDDVNTGLRYGWHRFDASMFEISAVEAVSHLTRVKGTKP